MAVVAKMRKRQSSQEAQVTFAGIEEVEADATERVEGDKATGRVESGGRGESCWVGGKESRNGKRD
jgi:hypothetical protein